MNTKQILDKLRAGPWLVLSLVMVLIVGWLYPHQLGVLLWSLTKLSFGAYLGYWIDRSIFYYGRPGDVPHDCNACMATTIRAVCYQLRRALIIASAILALGLGV
ncbi:MAG: hypothetical protein CMO06_09685 [Thalassospira sp.]|jgi:hypothetical protein|uniref:putative holin n=1 Tax=Thalassospira sp. TaxID=1912094 RepID=UPI000C3EA52B|nr:putative holin [Thalassospira sp.]MAZ33402.1 hypothetical protein [Thalassospira sp.]